MNKGTLRSGFSVVEALLGTLLVLYGCYELYVTANCPPNHHLCVATGAYAITVSLAPGLIILAGAVVSLFYRKLRLWVIQGVVVGALISYFALLFLFVYLVNAQ